MKRQRKYRAWNGEKMIFRGLHDKNWYTEPFGGKVVQTANQDDIHYLKVMDFTGLKDKNEVEIYENDICKTECGICQIVFQDGGFAYLITKNETFCPAYNWHIEELEVIGNIYENPELLKK